ncbi:MAG: S41 family peptidase [Calditrichaeota bacterium]|nr:MAG: S41 family peptidase [Calditrichota bacterium]
MTTDENPQRSIFLTLVFSIILLLIAGGISIYVISDKSIEDILLLSSAARTIEDNYPDEIDWDEMILSARDAMFAKLDRYSTFYQDEQFEQLDEHMSGGYSGIGISVLPHDSGLLIMSVRENGPAYEAGLMNGDIIEKADSVSFADLSPAKSSTLLRGKENTYVNITVYRPSSDERFDLKVERRRIPFLHIPFAGYTDDSVVYIRLLDFNFGASQDLEAALDSLVIQGAFRPKGIIIDLQGNPGGLFSEAYEIADLFLDEGYMIVGTDGRSRWEDMQYQSTGTDVTDGLPLILLVNNGSASASEIVSGALQSSERAMLVGDTTFGKGLVQGFVQFPNGDGLKLTVSRYFFGDSVYLNDFDSTLEDVGHGLVPDHFIESKHYTYFQRELENHLVLGPFTAMYEEDIIREYESDTLSDRWIGRLVGFMNDQGKSTRSYRTILAEDMDFIAGIESLPSKYRKTIRQIVETSQNEDLKQFYENRNYIKNRLIETAYKRKFGDYYSYKNLLLKIRPEIQFAEDLILGMEQ